MCLICTENITSKLEKLFSSQLFVLENRLVFYNKHADFLEMCSIINGKCLGKPTLC